MDTLLRDALGLLVVYLAGIVCLVQWKQDRSIANFTWGGGVLILALYTFWHSMPDSSFRPLLITVMVSVWAMRMIIHLYMRYTGKDPRFIIWRNQRGLSRFIVDMLYIYAGQSLLLVLMAYPVIFINMCNSGIPLTLLDAVGCMLWILGMFWEAVGDYQLFKFSKDPANKGKVMRYGLWQYTRHPNYFGEVTLWWGIFLIASNIPGGMTTIIAPCTIMVLLLYITGIPWVERAFADNPEFQLYKKNTNAFFPGRPHDRQV